MNRLCLRRYCLLMVASCFLPQGLRAQSLTGQETELEKVAREAEVTPQTSQIPRLTYQIRGRIDTDAIVASQSVTDKAVIGDLQNGYGFRRLRLGAEGKIEGTADFVAEIDFAGGGVRLRDCYIGLTALPGVSQLNVGYFREPFSLEGATSARFITFMERSPLNQFDPTRNWGVAGFWRPENDRCLFAVGGFRDGTNSGGFSGGDQNTWSVTTRLTGLPLYEPDEERFRLIHLGGAFSQRSPLNQLVTYAPEPQSNLLVVSDNPGSPFLPPINVPSKSQQLFNLQAAYVDGPISFQAEYFGTEIQQINAGSVYLHGFYAYVSWFATGEHRGYDPKRGGFDRVSVLRPVIKSKGSPTTGIGAIELASRFSISDYRSANLPIVPGSVTQGGVVLYEATLGLNWYLNDNLRLMTNYTMAIPEVPGVSNVPAHVVSMRLALYW